MQGKLWSLHQLSHNHHHIYHHIHHHNHDHIHHHNHYHIHHHNHYHHYHHDHDHQDGGGECGDRSTVGVDTGSSRRGEHFHTFAHSTLLSFLHTFETKSFEKGNTFYIRIRLVFSYLCAFELDTGRCALCTL